MREKIIINLLYEYHFSKVDSTLFMDNCLIMRLRDQNEKKEKKSALVIFKIP